MTDDRFKAGYAAARNYYDSRVANVHNILDAWAQEGPTKDRGREVIAQAWPDLYNAIEKLKEQA